jgi:hypothetical protein
LGDNATCSSRLSGPAGTVGVAAHALGGRDAATRCRVGLALARGQCLGLRSVAGAVCLLGCSAARAPSAQLFGVAAVEAPSAVAFVLASERFALGGIAA